MNKLVFIKQKTWLPPDSCNFVMMKNNSTIRAKNSEAGKPPTQQKTSLGAQHKPLQNSCGNTC